MIASLILALQLGAGSSGAAHALVVRGPDRSARIPIVASAAGPMVRAESLGEMLPLEVRRESATSYSIEVWGTRLRLRPGTAAVRVGGEDLPLAAAPRVSSGHLLVPLQLISEVFPAVVPNTRWDASTGQLVLFTSRSTGGTGSATTVGPRVSGRRSTSAGEVASGASRLPPVPAKRHRRTVIVDAGHGGVDDGMTGSFRGRPRLREKNITLAVALDLGRQLEARGVDVVYTRTTDTLIALDDRGTIANRASGDLFISIHVNAANPNWRNPGGARGFETYFLSEARTEDARRVEQMENDAARFETASKEIDKDDPLSFILSDMQQNMHLRESSELAELIQQHLATMHPGPSRGVKQAGFRVLVTAYMPAVLVEIGFGTNPTEAAFLAKPSKQRAIASAIADGAMQYLERYEGRMSSGARSGSGGGGTPR